MLLHSALDLRSHRHAQWTVAGIVVVLFGLSPGAALAQLSDVKGSKDHPMVSRKSQKVEGRATRILYVGPQEGSRSKSCATMSSS